MKLLIILLLFTANIFGKPQILVSIAPQKFFVDAIAQDTVQTTILVPAGASPHSFEPTPKQMIQASKADIWFRIGEPFETKAIEVLKSHNPQMLVVDTREGIPLLTMSEEAKCKHCAHQDDKDTHIWLSLRLAKIQVKTIKEALQKKIPQYADLYDNNYQPLIEKFNLLDEELAKLFSLCNEKTLLVSHPAFGYLAQDYGLKQLSIEIEGKDPSPKQLTTLLNRARALGVTRVYTQEQYQNKGAHLIAKEIGASIYTVDPYSEDYLNNLIHMCKLFAGQHEGY